MHIHRLPPADVDGGDDRRGWLDEVAEHLRIHGINRDELLFSTQVGTPISRNTFRSRVWLPAVAASGIDFRSGSTISAIPLPVFWFRRAPHCR